MERIFSGKTALVTGGNSGIGQATAIAFAARGANVVVSDITNSTETVDKIKASGGNAIFVQCDVSKESEVKTMVDKTIAAYGRLDYAYNNAGIEGKQGLLQDFTEADWDRTLNINLKGVFLCMKYELPVMVKQKSGAIVNCSSIAGLVGFMQAAPYTASKHAVVGVTKTAALENAKTGIRINAVCPGVIRTPMIDRVVQGNAEMEQMLTAGEPIGRMGKPEEIAETVVWLCSDAASFVTGIAMPVDGGWVEQ